MAAAMAKLEFANILLLKIIEAQGSVKPLDVVKTSDEWPGTAGAAPTVRAISDRVREIKKDAIARGFVNPSFSLPCANHHGAKSTWLGQRQLGARSKKRARDEDGDDVMETVDAGIGTKTTITIPNQAYLSPPSTSRTKSCSTFLGNAAPSSLIAPTPRGYHTTKRTICGTEVDDKGTDMDSDSDSLADLEDTPTKAPVKKQRIMPTRQNRAVKKYDTYADEDVVGAGGAEESDDEFDPFKLRQEQEKKDARKHRSCRYSKKHDSDE